MAAMPPPRTAPAVPGIAPAPPPTPDRTPRPPDPPGKPRVARDDSRDLELAKHTFVETLEPSFSRNVEHIEFRDAFLDTLLDRSAQAGEKLVRFSDRLGCRPVVFHLGPPTSSTVRKDGFTGNCQVGSIRRTSRRSRYLAIGGMTAQERQAHRVIGLRRGTAAHVARDVSRRDGVDANTSSSR
jgi:hypothetical protein